MDRLSRVWREPFVQFLLLGGLIFGLYAATRGSRGHGGDAGGGEPDRRIVITAAEIETLRADFRATSKREPSAEELGDQIESWVHDEILFREGKALGLERDDVVVRRRVVEKMSALARPQTPMGEPSPADLRRWYDRYRHRFAQPGRLSFEQRFFDPKRRGDAAADAKSALAAVAEADLGDPTAIGAGDEFVLPAQLVGKSDLQVAHLFGEAFLAAVVAAPLRRWQGPVASQFGPHLVFVIDRETPRQPKFEEVTAQVRADWLTVNTRGVKPAAESLLPRYQVVLQGAEPQKLAATPAVAPLLERH